MRIGITIIFNGLCHLQHNDYAERLLEMLDYWIIVEGAAGNSGSTSWCKEMPKKYHNNGSSIDGTVEFLREFGAANIDKVSVVLATGIWKSKDEMINRSLKSLYYMGTPVYLWQIDIDEQWTKEQMDEAEYDLICSYDDTGMFLCDCYVGKYLLAKGEWGEGKQLPYRRLWRWKGQSFISHEPPILKGGNGKEILLSQRFKHYPYYFLQDINFKEDYYGYEGLYKRWKDLQKETKFPQPINRLIPGKWGESNTEIIHMWGLNEVQT